MPMLQPWPFYNQLKDWTVDVDGVDENAKNNCGPESVAMCLKYLTGVELPADFIKDVMKGPHYTGYTFTSDLTKFLEEKCEIPCEVHNGNAQTMLQPVVQRAIDNGYPIIVLYFWNINQPESGHWAPVIAYDSQGCSRMNPWGGVLEQWSWRKFERWQKYGHCIVLKRTRDKNLDEDTRDGVINPLTNLIRARQQEARAYVEAALLRGAGSVDEVLGQ